MNEWTTDTNERCFIDSCAHSKDMACATIHIDKATWDVIVHLTRTIQDEWQMFLSGTIENNTVFVTGYWIPKQTVGPSTVSNEDIIDKQVVDARRLVASIHSHSNMAVFHSQTDIDSTCKSAWIKHHITVNNRLEYVAKSQMVLPCGKIAFVTTPIEIENDTNNILVEGIENIARVAPSMFNGMHFSHIGNKSIIAKKEEYDDVPYKSLWEKYKDIPAKSLWEEPNDMRIDEEHIFNNFGG